MDRDQSEFNYAIEWLRTIRYGFDACWEARIKKDAYSWIENLTGVFLELSSQMNNEEIIQKLNELKQFNESINKKNNEFETELYISKELYWKLIDFQLYLNEVMRQSHLITRIKEDASFALK